MEIIIADYAPLLGSTPQLHVRLHTRFSSRRSGLRSLSVIYQFILDCGVRVYAETARRRECIDVGLRTGSLPNLYFSARNRGNG